MDARETTVPDEVGPLPALPTGARCPDCTYDLRGSTSARCPECGLLLDVLRSLQPQIAWARRSEIGWFRAYWKTVWNACMRPKLFCLEMLRPVSYADAQAFRWVSALHAVVPVLSLAVILLALGATFDSDENIMNEPGAGWTLCGMVVWFLLMVALMPGLASYFFQSKCLTTEQQNRAIALSYYAWAPWAAAPVSLVVILVLLPFWCSNLGDAVALFVLPCVYIGISAAVALTLNGFLKHTLQRPAFARLLRAGVLAVSRFTLMIVLACVPLGVFYLMIIAESLRGSSE